MTTHSKETTLPPFLQVWIVGKAINQQENVWEFQGVFTTQEEATRACDGHPNYFYAPAELGKLLPDETAREWPGAVYPNMPTRSLFLRRLDAFTHYPEIAALHNVLSDIVQMWSDRRAAAIIDGGGEAETQALDALADAGNAVASTVEALHAGAMARGHRHPLQSILAMMAEEGAKAEVRSRFEGIASQRFTLAAADVLRERVKQEEKWGEQNHGPETWLTILHEESGELAQAILHTRYGGRHSGLHKVRMEAVHAAAVALSMIESLDRAKWEWPMENPMCVLQDKARLWTALSDIVGVSNFQDLQALDSLFRNCTPPHLGVVQAAVQALLCTEPEKRTAKHVRKAGKADSH